MDYLVTRHHPTAVMNERNKIKGEGDFSKNNAQLQQLAELDSKKPGDLAVSHLFTKEEREELARLESQVKQAAYGVKEALRAYFKGKSFKFNASDIR